MKDRIFAELVVLYIVLRFREYRIVRAHDSKGRCVALGVTKGSAVAANIHWRKPGGSIGKFSS